MPPFFKTTKSSACRSSRIDYLDILGELAYLIGLLGDSLSVDDIIGFFVERLLLAFTEPLSESVSENFCDVERSSFGDWSRKGVEQSVVSGDVDSYTSTILFFFL